MMKRILALLPVILCLLTLSSCAPSAQKEMSFFAMDTYMSIKLYEKSSEKAANDVKKSAESLDALLSVTKDNSDIHRLNQAKGEPVAVEEQTFSVIEHAAALCADLDGYLDLSLYPVSKAWGFTTDDYRVPEKDEIEKLLTHTDYRKIRTDQQENTVTLPEDMQIDLGAFAKGYLADLAVGILKESDDVSGIIDFGGTILPWGMKNKKDLWKVGIQDPENPSSCFGTLSLTEKVISTSGGYERYFTGKDGKRYIHIIDPKTGYPVDNGTLSVTVVCDVGICADALSTALFVMGEEKAAEFYRADSKYDFEYILLGDNNELFVSEGISECFALCDGYDYSVNVIKKS